MEKPHHYHVAGAFTTWLIIFIWCKRKKEAKKLSSCTKCNLQYKRRNSLQIAAKAWEYLSQWSTAQSRLCEAPLQPPVLGEKQKCYHLALNAIYNTKAGTHCKLLLRLGTIFHNGRQLKVGYVEHLYNLQFQEMVRFSGRSRYKMKWRSQWCSNIWVSWSYGYKLGCSWSWMSAPLS